MIITVSNPDTLAGLLHGEFREASGTSVKRMITQGMISVNGKVNKNPSTRLNSGDKVEYRKMKKPVSGIHLPVPVVFEDKFILVVEKPPGILTYGERRSGGTSLYKIILSQYKQESDGRERLFVVHRLDREVSGLVIFAKQEEIQQKLKDSWYSVTKKYFALVEGKPPMKSGTIRSYVAENSSQRVFSVRDPDKGKLAVTNYDTLKELPENTLLEITIETGRKNQIRVHLSEAGYPVVGDYRYGADSTYRRRIRLHAYYLSFVHPVTGQTIECSVPVPAKFTLLQPENEVYK